MGTNKPSIPGFQDGGNAVEPTTGNEVPIGSLPNEVADDIPAKLSEGEFVLPADVVRFIGLERLMKLRDDAKEGLRRMAEIGQMGNAEAVGEKADDSFEEGEEEEEEDTEGFESDIDDIMAEVEGVEGQTEQAFAKGGAVGSQPWLSGFDMTKAPKNPVFDVRYYKHSDGRMMYVTFFNGKPMTPIPDGFTPTDKPTEQLVGKEAEEKKKIPEGGGDSGGPGGSDVQAPAGPEGVKGSSFFYDETGALRQVQTPFGIITTGDMLGKIANVATPLPIQLASLLATGKTVGTNIKAQMTPVVDRSVPSSSMPAPNALNIAEVMSDYLESGAAGAAPTPTGPGPSGIVGGNWGDMPDLSLSGPFDASPAPAPEPAPAPAPPAAVSSPVTDYSSSVPSGTDAPTASDGYSVADSVGMSGFDSTGNFGSDSGGYSGSDSGGYGGNDSGMWAKGGFVSKQKKPAKKSKGKGLASR